MCCSHSLTPFSEDASEKNRHFSDNFGSDEREAEYRLWARVFAAETPSVFHGMEYRNTLIDG
ncbi:hypothetical protein [Alicyclobacillus sp. SO9]|uniref:hypothetical protein n=1 Tax=Alicyclobacillus sp. SO9 TaxID=2665646 RepID=UPI0018E81D81|nr:hypothetical protein [Alicyclobacillus sp. SO9]QQE76773.1 hypothetical protein GI364_12145 [Alicyclobacillus sp. SO9]